MLLSKTALPFLYLSFSTCPLYLSLCDPSGPFPGLQIRSRDTDYSNWIPVEFFRREVLFFSRPFYYEFIDSYNKYPRIYKVAYIIIYRHCKALYRLLSLRCLMRSLIPKIVVCIHPQSWGSICVLNQAIVSLRTLICCSIFFFIIVDPFS
jgi:hypothetical protein